MANIEYADSYDLQSAGDAPFKGAGSARTAKAGDMSEQARRRMLLGSYAILFTRYGIATFLSAFFPLRARQLHISPAMDGLIFASYPIGITITSALAPQFILRVGTRNAIVFGLVCTSVCTLIFGFVPDMFPHPHQQHLQQYAFLVMYFLSGLLGAFAETASIMLSASKFPEKVGTVMASIGTVTGIGCLAGPPLGGVLNVLTDSPTWNFRLPFMFYGVLAGALVFVALVYMPQEKLDGSEEQGDFSDTFGMQAKHGPQRCATLVAVALNGLIVATLDPTLGLRLHAGFGYGSGEVGFFFMYSSLTYVAISIPIGWLVDKYPTSPAIFESVQATGFFVLFLTFALLGPLELGSPIQALNNLTSVAVAMALKGVGSSCANAAYPDLTYGADPNDKLAQATIAGMWNAAYSFGWSLGPLSGGWLYGVFGGSPHAVSLKTEMDNMAFPGHSLNHDHDPVTPDAHACRHMCQRVKACDTWTATPTADGRYVCALKPEWGVACPLPTKGSFSGVKVVGIPKTCSDPGPDVGFSGFATVIALLSLTGGILMMLVAAHSYKAARRLSVSNYGAGGHEADREQSLIGASSSHL